jgi:DNA-binding response OmpR family regulator
MVPADHQQRIADPDIDAHRLRNGGDRVQGLGIGADDYLSKPFDFGELVARIHALGRRAYRPLPPVLRRKGSSWTLHAVWQLETGGASI